MVMPRKLWSTRQWKQIKTDGRCESCIQKQLINERSSPRSPRIAKAKNREKNALLLAELVAIDDEARKAKKGIEATTVLLTGPDMIRPTIIKKLDGFTHENLAQILIRAGFKAQIETESFIRKEYNKYLCKITNDWVPAGRWHIHVMGKRKKHFKDKMKEANKAKKKAAKTQMPLDCPTLEAIPKEELAKMSEADLEVALKSRELLYRDHCLICQVRVMAAWEKTHCTGGPHQTAFKKCPMRRKKGKDGRAKLPEEWKEFTENGILTYHNDETGETTTVRPGSSAAAESSKRSRSPSRKRGRSWERKGSRRRRE